MKKGWLGFYNWDTMYNKTIIGFGFCDMQNYQGLGIRVISRAECVIN